MLANENPVPNEAVDAVDAVGAVLPTPKPANDDPAPADEEPAPVDATGAAANENPLLAGAEDAGAEDETIAAPVVVVEAVVVVTVENSGTEDVVKEKEPGGFEAAGVPETVEADETEAEAEEDGTLVKANAG